MSERGWSLPRPSVGAVAGPVLLVLVGVVASRDPFWLFLATSGAVAYVLTASFNIIYGYAGVFSLAHVSLYGIGAYTAVLLEIDFGVPFLLATVAAVIVAALFGVVLWWPTRHLKELFLAIATLGFAVTVEELFLKWTSVTGGGQGVLGIPPPEIFGTVFLSGDLPFFWLVAAGALTTWEISRRMTGSGLGLKMIALRDAPVALAATGVSPGRVRLVAFVVSSGLAGLAGSLFAHHTLFISSESFGLGRLIELVLAALLGGIGTSAGPLIGVVVLVAIDEAGASLLDYRELIFGVAIIGLLGYGRGGVVGLFQRAVARIRPAQRIRARPSVTEPLTFDTPGPGDVFVRGVSVNFGGVAALTDIDLRLASGTVLGLIGPNGAGKTTLVNVITGYVGPTTGEVHIDELRLSDRDPDSVVDAGVVRTFQTPRLIGEESLVTNVALGFASHAHASVVEEVFNLSRARQDTAEALAAAEALLGRLGIDENVDSPAAVQPYAVQRLTEIARALATGPRFLLLDEPGAGLTDDERGVLTAIIREVAKRGIGVLLIDHNVSFVAETANRLVVLDGGRVLAEGCPDDVLASPEVSSAYLGSDA